jgi:hypothetical protein
VMCGVLSLNVEASIIIVLPIFHAVRYISDLET